MLDNLKQLDFEKASDSELRKWFNENLPIIEALVNWIRKSVRNTSQGLSKSPCESCNSLGQCDPNKCKTLSKLIGSTEQKNPSRKSYSLFDNDALHEYNKSRRAEIYEQLKGCQIDYSDLQWQVLESYYKEGKSDQQISEILGKSRSAVNGLRNRALKVFKRYTQKIRKEQVEAYKSINM